MLNNSRPIDFIVTFLYSSSKTKKSGQEPYEKEGFFHGSLTADIPQLFKHVILRIVHLPSQRQALHQSLLHLRETRFFHLLLSTLPHAETG